MLSYEKKVPVIGEKVFIAQGVCLIGEVVIGNDSSVFFNSVLRGDINSITIGERTNIQDNCTFHVASDKPVILLPGFGRDLSLPRDVTSLVDSSVGWDERALVDAIRSQARHEETTRWDTIEFKSE